MPFIGFHRQNRMFVNPMKTFKKQAVPLRIARRVRALFVKKAIQTSFVPLDRLLLLQSFMQQRPGTPP